MSNTLPPPQVIFFGMMGNFSIHPLLALLEQHINVSAVVLPTKPLPGHDMPPIQLRKPTRADRLVIPQADAPPHSSIAHIAWDRSIPVYQVRDLAHAETLATLSAFQPDMICVACFSLRIPLLILQLPRLGCLNVHPSLLPANRGPIPLFWTFRNADATTGVTVHLMDEHMDSGDILNQESIAVPDGINYVELEHQCAMHGGTLLAKSVWELYEGRAQCIPQDEAQSSYHSYPSQAEILVRTDEWDARHVYNYVRGVAPLYGSIELQVGNTSLWARSAVAYTTETDSSTKREVRENADTTVSVPCKTGCVTLAFVEML